MLPYLQQRSKGMSEHQVRRIKQLEADNDALKRENDSWRQAGEEIGILREALAQLEGENAELKGEIAVAQDCINQYLDEDHQRHTEDITILAMAEAILRKALLTEESE